MVVERVPMQLVPLLPHHAEAVPHVAAVDKHTVVGADNLTAAAGRTSNLSTPRVKQPH
jgi:hypothetical protein